MQLVCAGACWRTAALLSRDFHGRKQGPYLLGTRTLTYLPQPALSPVGALSRATLLGTAARVDDSEVAEVRSRFAVAHRGRCGVDAVQDSDLYWRLTVDRVFYVGGLGSVRGRCNWWT